MTAGGMTALRRRTGVSLCQECGKCTTLCPLVGFDGFTAAGVVAIRDDATITAAQAAAVQRCLTCGLCEVRCPQGVHFKDFVRGLREDSVAAGQPCPHGQVFEAAARLEAVGRAGARDLSWLEPDLRIAESGELALFVGCLPLFDAQFGDLLDVRPLDIARAAIRTLNKLGIEPVIVDGERCCGHDLLWSGDASAFEALAAGNAAAFEARGVDHILTTCAECARTWRLDYAEAAPGYRPKVQHMAEFLADRLAEDHLFLESPDGEATVTYQDPCRLGRHLGVVDEPRQILDAAPGVHFEDMARRGTDAQCCGTAGFMLCNAESRRMQTERLREAGATGAETLLTACPKCLIHFACAQEEDGRLRPDGEPIRVEDFTVFADRMLRSASEIAIREQATERTGAVT